MELQSFISKFAEQFDDTDPGLITAATNFQDLEEWSSLTTMVVIAFIQTEYNKNVTGTEIRTCKTVNDLFNFIQKNNLNDSTCIKYPTNTNTLSVFSN